jgi:HSP20 family molecular chaperone IbpA
MAKKTTNAVAKKKSTPVKKTATTKSTPTAEVATAKKEIAIINSPFWNIWDTGKSYKVSIPIAGLCKKDISVITNGNQLIISSEKENSKEKKDKNYIVQQYSFSSWSKSISLPEPISEKDIKIIYKDGVLKIEMNKLAPKVK